VARPPDPTENACAGVWCDANGRPLALVFLEGHYVHVVPVDRPDVPAEPPMPPHPGALERAAWRFRAVESGALANAAAGKEAHDALALRLAWARAKVKVEGAPAADPALAREARELSLRLDGRALPHEAWRLLSFAYEVGIAHGRAEASELLAAVIDAGARVRRGGRRAGADPRVTTARIQAWREELTADVAAGRPSAAGSAGARWPSPGGSGRAGVPSPPTAGSRNANGASTTTTSGRSAASFCEDLTAHNRARHTVGHHRPMECARWTSF